MKIKAAKIISVLLVFVMLVTAFPTQAFAGGFGTPSITSVSNTYKGVKISWKKVDKAKGYVVSRKTGKKGKWSKLGTTAKAEYVDAKAKTGKTYYYRVKAYKGSKNKKYSKNSAVKSKKFIESPELLSVSEKKGWLLLKYKKIENADMYYIYRKTGKNGKYQMIAKTRSTSYKDESCKSKKTYYYRVVASSKGVNSGKCKEKSCKVTYYAGDCDHETVDHKVVIKPTSVLKGYTINYCKCERCYQVSNIKKATGDNVPSGNLPAYAQSVKRNNASLKYLDEMLKKDRVNLLQIYFGSNDDIRALKKVADTITAGCKTDYDKAYALYDWVINNVEYNIETGAMATDVMRTKQGDCAGMSQFVCDCLRLLNIPAVVLTGYVGDTKEVFTINNMDAVSGGIGHEWVRAYVNGEWIFIDCTFQRFYTSKDNFDVPAWYYTVSTDCAIPYYKGMDFHFSSGHPVYINGKYYAFDDNGEQCDLEMAGTGLFVLPNLNYSFALCGIGSNIDNPKQLMNRQFTCDEKKYMPGQMYTSTKISICSKVLNYQGYIGQTYYNGREVSQTTFSFDGINYLNDGWMAYKNYSGKHLAYFGDGPSLQVGETITLQNLITLEKGQKVKWSSSNPAVATVDQKGNVKAKSAGWTTIDCTETTKHIFDSSVTIYVGYTDYKLKDSDLAPQSSIKVQRSKILKPGKR